MNVYLKINEKNFTFSKNFMFCKIIENDTLQTFYNLENGEFYFENKKVDVKIELEDIPNFDYNYHYRDTVMLSSSKKCNFKIGDIIKFRTF